MTTLGDGVLLWLGAYALHSSLFLAGVLLIERLLKHATPALLSTLWRTALLAGVATATLQASGLVDPVAGRFAILPAATEAAPPSTVPVLQPQIVDPILLPDTPVIYAWPETAATATATTGSGASEPVVTGRTGVSPDWPLDWRQLGATLLYAWAGIASFLVLRAAYVWWAAHRELRDRQPVVQGPLFERIQALAHDVGLRRLPQVSFSERIAGPFTLPSGEICIPVWARERLPDRQLDAMLAHEMAHVLHRDSLWLAIGMGLSTVFFFQPLNLLARRRLANLAELSADDWAATRAGSGRPLAECISTFVDIAHARAKAIATPEFAAAMAKPKSELVQRVERLLNNRYTSGVLPMKTKLLIGACALAFAAVLPGLSAQAHDQPAPLAPVPPVAPQSPAAPEAVATPEAPWASEALEGAAALKAPASPEAPPALATPEAAALAEAPEADAVAEVPALDPAPEPQRNVSISRDNGTVRMNITTTRGLDYKLTATANGEIDLAPDGSGVRHMSDGSYLDATLSRGLQTRRVRYTGSGGGIRREFWAGGQSRPWGPEADAFVAELMPILLRETGINAKERVDWFLKQRGQDALFAEIGLIDSDSVQTAYVGRWFDTTMLAAPMFERVMALVGNQMDSDSHLQATLDKAFKTQNPKGRQLVQLLKAGQSIDSDSHVYAVLDEVAPEALAADDTAAAYFELARSIDSDSHMQAAFSKAVASASISDARVADIIRLSGQDIDSDSHLDAVLRSAARRVGASDALARDYIAAVGSIDSDSHNMDALEFLAREARLSPAGWRDLIAAAARIDSDSHKSALLVSVAPRIAASDELSNAYVNAARTIDSDSHGVQALEALAREARLSPAGWRALIDATARIGSDSHKSALLVTVASRMPRESGVVAAYHTAAGSIGSDSHRGAAERALR
ncbi:MAG TPA: M56 family metallopeptidase [Hyphomonadaceae bacterium]